MLAVDLQTAAENGPGLRAPDAWGTGENGFRAKERNMRNHADEMLFIGTERKQPHREGKVFAFGDARSQSSTPKCASTRGLRSRWVMVDGKLELIWSGDEGEPLRRIA
jgi:hypothetical protein